jgi:hypothetical protein
MAQLGKGHLQENSRPVPALKQPYRRPELLRYGTLRDITLAVGFSGTPDGVDCGIGPNDKHCKTSP